jgi:hypothetical protein
MRGAATFIRWIAVLAAIAASFSSPHAVAKTWQDANRAQTITLRVYDYVHVDRRILLAAETEVREILAGAAVSSRWIDCPTSHEVVNDFPDCQAPPQFNDYVLSIVSGTMAAHLQSSEDTMGAADESINGSRRAAIFFSRIRSNAGGDAAPTQILLGRVMAHEIGHMLLGPNAHSRTGIMQAAWSLRELSMESRHEMVFTAEQSQIIEKRLAAQLLLQQALVAKNNQQ